MPAGKEKTVCRSPQPQVAAVVQQRGVSQLDGTAVAAVAVSIHAQDSKAEQSPRAYRDWTTKADNKMGATVGLCAPRT